MLTKKLTFRKKSAPQEINLLILFFLFTSFLHSLATPLAIPLTVSDNQNPSEFIPGIEPKSGSLLLNERNQLSLWIDPNSPEDQDEFSFFTLTQNQSILNNTYYINFLLDVVSMETIIIDDIFAMHWCIEHACGNQKLVQLQKANLSFIGDINDLKKLNQIWAKMQKVAIQNQDLTFTLHNILFGKIKTRIKVEMVPKMYI